MGNPNSANQLWSRWTFRIKPGRPVPSSSREIRENVSPLLAKIFGSVSSVRVQPDLTTKEWVVDLLTEGAPIHEKEYREYVRKLLLRLFQDGFGVTTSIAVQARVVAGPTENGTPDAQLVIMPHISLLGPPE